MNQHILFKRIATNSFDGLPVAGESSARINSLVTPVEMAPAK
jgi:hypothetical protein